MGLKIYLQASLLLSGLLFFNASLAQHPGFNQIYSFALQGNVKTSLDILDTLSNELLSEKQQEIKGKYTTRFVSRLKVGNSSGDPLVDEFIGFFHEYWINNMLNVQKLSMADSILKENIVRFLLKNLTDKPNKKMILEDVAKYCNTFLQQRGLYSNAFGKTAHLYDLFVWKNNDEKDYDIKLLDSKVNVKVHLMQDFVCLGWAGFASFNRSYAGGWARRDALYAVKDSYDLESENYKISYLCHEGQHFQDYKTFPKLQGTDLEYRAKLIELIKLEDTFWQKLEHFIRNGALIKGQPHPYANYTIAANLSHRLLDVEYEKELKKWKEIGAQTIKKECQKLFNEHTANLNNAGAETITNYIDRD